MQVMEDGIEESVPDKPFFSLPEIAELLDMPERTVREHLILGTMPGIKIGRVWRIARYDLIAYLRKNSNQPKA